jgi:phosphatidate cytidylyltransferase
MGCFIFFVLFFIEYNSINYIYQWLTWGGLFFWAIVVFLLLRLGVDFWRKIPVSITVILGFLILIPTWHAVVSAREIGINFLMSILCLVWVSDIAAYFGGKKFGKRKLASSISPGKTWEGVITAIITVCVVAHGWIWIDKYIGNQDLSFYSLIFNKMNYFLFISSILFLVGVGIAGDLFESMMKRSVNLKDSSQLLPGHGGILDRIDALIPVITIAILMHSYLKF